MRRKNDAEINIYSTSAIDLFASGMGVFLILVVIALPRISNKSKDITLKHDLAIEQLVKELDRLAAIERDFLRGLSKYTKNIHEVDAKLRKLAASNKTAMSKVEGVQHVARTITDTQSLIDEILKNLTALNQIETSTLSKLNSQKKQMAQMRRSVKDLQSQVNNMKNQEKTVKNTYVAVIMRWETPMHDIDLHVIDPSGKTHAFKGEITESVMSDATRGPGAEVWYVQKPEAGKYQINAYFHGRYGNKENPKVRATIVDTRNIQIIPEVELQQEGRFYSIGSFTITEKQIIDEIRTPAGVLSLPTN